MELQPFCVKSATIHRFRLADAFSVACKLNAKSKHPRTMKKTFIYKTFAATVALSACFVISAKPTTFAIDSLNGEITANEIKQFTNSINSMVPPTNNWGDNMSTHGTEVEGMRRMYEATGNMNILNRLIFFCDIALVHRNDQALGEHRTMWDGTVAPG